MQASLVVTTIDNSALDIAYFGRHRQPRPIEKKIDQGLYRLRAYARAALHPLGDFFSS
jgi:hypothetical protein